jgi:hypothetical protein
MQVTSPGGNTVHTLTGKSGDKFEFKAPRGGMYKFCFHNPHGAPETVSFMLVTYPMSTIWQKMVSVLACILSSIVNLFSIKLTGLRVKISVM